jgi:hypothetical protein
MRGERQLTNSKVPIIIGVTGHRDIPKEDEEWIRKAVYERLTELKKQYVHSPFYLISGLAEGADRLVAEAALEIGFGLLAALPMDQAEYEKDFETPASLQHFRDLISRAQKCFVVQAVTDNDENEQNRNERYLALGHYVARHSQIVIALWDGVSEQVTPDGKTQVLMGGTADVVRLCRNGLPSGEIDQIVVPEITQVYHLCVRRERQKEIQSKNHVLQVGRWDISFDAQTTIALSAIDRFNEHSASLPRELLDKCREWLIEDHPPQAAIEQLATPIAIFSAADAASGKRQAERSSAIKWISTLAIASVVCQQIYSGPDMRLGWVVGHIFLAFLAYYAFRLFFRGRHPREEQYLDWRALAEGLRVQIFWLASGVKDSVAEHYLSCDRDELDWIRQAVRNSVIGLSPIESQEVMKWVRNAWIKSQLTYFTKKVPENYNNHFRYSRLSKGFFFAGLTVTVITLLANMAGESALTLNGFVLASGICFLMSAVLKTYVDQMAFEEQQNRYHGMSEIFKMALNRYDELIAGGNDVRARCILFNVGKEALTENAGWLRLHRLRQFEGYAL